jgi:hypothetical protein
MYVFGIRRTLSSLCLNYTQSSYLQYNCGVPTGTHNVVLSALTIIER